MVLWSFFTSFTYFCMFSTLPRMSSTWVKNSSMKPPTPSICRRTSSSSFSSCAAFSAANRSFVISLLYPLLILSISHSLSFSRSTISHIFQLPTTTITNRYIRFEMINICTVFRTFVDCCFGGFCCCYLFCCFSFYEYMFSHTRSILSTFLSLSLLSPILFDVPLSINLYIFLI